MKGGETMSGEKIKVEGYGSKVVELFTKAATKANWSPDEIVKALSEAMARNREHVNVALALKGA